MISIRRAFCAAAAGVFFLAAGSGTAQADGLVEGFSGGSELALSSWTVGYRFVVGGDALEVSALGAWDDGEDGLAQSHEVGIWSDAGVLLAQATIPAGTSATLSGGFRYVSIPALTLSDNTAYRIGDFHSGGDPFMIGTTATLSPFVSYDAKYVGPGSFSFPGTLGAPQNNQGAFGPNAQFTAVPEPGAAAAAAALGLAGFALCRRAMRR